MQIKPDIITVTAYVGQMDEWDMATLNALFWHEEQWLEGHVDFNDAKQLLDIFSNDWAIHRYDRGHSFAFSVEFMLLMEPLLKRTDVDKIYFEMLEA